MRSDKKFDAVKMMREIRDKLSKEFVNLSYDEQKRYIRERIKTDMSADECALRITERIWLLATCLRHYALRPNYPSGNFRYAQPLGETAEVK